LNQIIATIQANHNTCCKKDTIDKFTTREQAAFLNIVSDKLGKLGENARYLVAGMPGLFIFYLA